MGGAIAASDLDKVLALAKQRYGSQAVQNVVAWRSMMEESRQLPEAVLLEKVNLFFNRRMVFDSDANIWQREDYWATPLEFLGKGAGDCEDFSIAKYVTLHLLGVSSERLRLIRPANRARPVPHGSLVLGPEP